MRHWLVTVDCIAAKSPMVRLKIMVDADTSADAMRQARTAAEENAGFGIMWVAFEVREAASRTPPWIVSRVQWVEEAKLTKRQRRDLRRMYEGSDT